MSIFRRLYKGMYFLFVGNNPIEYVDSLEHHGHVITNQLTDYAHILKRRNDFAESL